MYTVQTYETLIIKDRESQQDTIQAWADRCEFQNVADAKAAAFDFMRLGKQPGEVRVIKKVAEYSVNFLH